VQNIITSIVPLMNELLHCSAAVCSLSSLFCLRIVYIVLEVVCRYSVIELNLPFIWRTPFELSVYTAICNKQVYS